MRCYFSAQPDSEDRLKKHRRVISFVIPDMGVIFRSLHFGTLVECGYVSLLALLTFIEKNPKFFSNQQIEIYTNIPLIVYQINKNVFCEKEARVLKDMAVLYKRKLDFFLNWIPKEYNKAILSLEKLPSAGYNLQLDFDTVQKVLRSDDNLNKGFVNLSF